MGRVEFDYWRGGQHGPAQRTPFADSIQPVFEAGLVDLVETDHRLCDEVSLVPTLGHTPGPGDRHALCRPHRRTHRARWRRVSPRGVTPRSVARPMVQCARAD